MKGAIGGTSSSSAILKPTVIDYCNKVRKEGRKQTGLAREDSGEFYLQINLNRCALCAS